MLTTERKTKIASLAVFFVSLLGLSALSTFATDLTPLPDWLESPAYAGVLWLTARLSGYYTKHRPAELSPSAVEAFRSRLGSRPGYTAPSQRVSDMGSDLNPAGPDRSA